MAYSTGFRKGSVRSWALGAVMIGVLSGALAVAYGLVVARRQPWLVNVDPKAELNALRVGDLQLWTPKSLIQSDFTGHGGDVFDDSVQLLDQTTANRTLVIGGIKDYQPRAPRVVLKQMLERLIPPDIHPTLRRWQPAVNFRSQNLIGVLYGAIGQNGDRNHLNLLAVLTQDGRRYWAIYISHLVEPSMSQSTAARYNRQLMAHLLSRATGHNLRAAQVPDFVAAGLPYPPEPAGESPPSYDWLPEGLQAHVTPSNRGGDPIMLLPSSGMARVAVIRLRGVVDAGGSEPQDPLSPATLLAGQIQEVLGRPPVDGELWSGRIDKTPVWRASLVAPNQSLVRQVWYARPGENRGLLLETLSELNALGATKDWAIQIIQAAAARFETADFADSSDSIRQGAFARGQEVAQRQTASIFNRTDNDRIYYLIREDGRLIGGQVEHITNDAKGNPPAAEGYAKVVRRVGSGNLMVDQSWRVNDNAERFSLTSRWLAAGPDIKDRPANHQVLRVVKMQLSNNTITFQQSADAGQVLERWSATVPEAFVVPMAEEAWPVGVPADFNDAESLIWMTRSRHKPKPYWIRVFSTPPQQSNAQPHDHQAVHEIWLRPLMSLGIDRATYDSRGIATSYESSRIDGPTRGARIVMTRVDGHQATTLFPALESQDNPETPDGATEP